MVISVIIPDLNCMMEDLALKPRPQQVGKALPIAAEHPRIPVKTRYGEITLNDLDKKPGQDPSASYRAFDHILWYVGNAKQAAAYFVTRFGFRRVAYQGLETGSRNLACHVVSNGKCTFVLMAPVRGPDMADATISDKDKMSLAKIHQHLAQHGDGVTDVAFEVDDVRAVYQQAVSRGAKSVVEPMVQKDEHGEVVFASIEAYGDTTHSFVERSLYKGVFLPGFRPVQHEDPTASCLPPVPLEEIDHCVGNHDWGKLETACKYYESSLGFHRFWSPDDDTMLSDYSTMNSVVVASQNEVIKMPLNEPALGLKKSQIEEFIEYYGSAGVQHVAFRTNDIVQCVFGLVQRGTEFIRVPSTYYKEMALKLKAAGMGLQEDIATLERLNILIDFDQRGYLLQTFTKPLGDRPTVFLEVIQRRNFDGFGAGNFKALFEAIEREQMERGNS